MATITKKAPKSCVEVLTSFLAASIHGQCYHFAIALHYGLGWPIVGLVETKKIIHVGVRSPEGKIWDGRGEVSEKDFIDPFSKSSCAIREVAEKNLDAREQ